MIGYRNAIPSDAAALSTAAVASFVETFGTLYRPADLDAFVSDCLSPDAFAGELADPLYAIRLCVDDDRIVGFAKLGPPGLPVDDPGAELWQLYVLAPWHGTGVAATLMGWALDRARSAGHHLLHLSVWVDNHRAKRFYARYGAVDVGRYDFPVGDQIDEDRILRIAL